MRSDRTKKYRFEMVRKPGDELAWAEMLSQVGTKLCRLSGAVEKPGFQAPKMGARTIAEELQQERARLARELHAGAGQPLAGIKLNLEILQEGSSEYSLRAQQAIVRLEALAEQALQQLRAVSHRLHPPAWQALPVSQAIGALIESSGVDAHCKVSVVNAGLGRDPSYASRIALYRCAQECISNIIRHSGATEVRFALAQVTTNVGEAIRLEVVDNGRGFDTNGIAAGIGLRAMEEHSGALGGECRITSGPNGTTVTILVPLDEDD